MGRLDDAVSRIIALKEKLGFLVKIEKHSVI